MPAAMPPPGPAHILVVGPVPPPVTGRTVVTKRFVEELARSNVSYTVINTAVSPAGSPLRRGLRRAVYLALYAFHVARAVRRANTAYIPVDASPGTVFTALYALLARLAGVGVVLHHHSSSYIRRPTLAMRGLCRVAGRDALHVTPCAAVSAELGARYPRIQHTAVLSNAFAVDRGLAATAPKPAGDRLVLGHLSNLTAAKGVLTVIACFAELRARGEEVELHLAGPIQDEAVARAVRDAADRFGPVFRYHGPVDPAAKRAFFSSLDVFLFPTTFRNEVQPVVVLEALAAGIPVIAFGVACIPSLLRGGCGIVVARDGDFKATTLSKIAAWRQNRDALRAAANAAEARYRQLRDESRGELAQLITWLARERRERHQEVAPKASLETRLVLQRGTDAKLKSDL